LSTGLCSGLGMFWYVPTYPREVFLFFFCLQVHYPSDPMQPGPIYFLTPCNCSGQNKNEFVLWYCAWRTIHELHHSLDIHFLITGHIKLPLTGASASLRSASERPEWTLCLRLLVLWRTALWQGWKTMAVNNTWLCTSGRCQSISSTGTWGELHLHLIVWGYSVWFHWTHWTRG
jgi:hypothetical protein